MAFLVCQKTRSPFKLKDILVTSLFSGNENYIVFKVSTRKHRSLALENCAQNQVSLSEEIQV